MSWQCIVYALKKFTGGMGDDDDRSGGGSESIWKRYFTKVQLVLEDCGQFSCVTNLSCSSHAYYTFRLFSNMYSLLQVEFCALYNMVLHPKRWRYNCVT